MLALCCTKLGKYHEAESALQPKLEGEQVRSTHASMLQP